MNSTALALNSGRHWKVKGKSPQCVDYDGDSDYPGQWRCLCIGDLDVSFIKGMPPGRHPVKTYVVGSHMLQRIFRFMKKEMESGHQAYVVCPLVEQSEKQDLAAAVSVYENLRDHVFPQFGVGLVHGRMKNAEKEQVMEDFRKGKFKLLVATSVIEVGVNVPDATVMFVYGADRFGLSQLHQLRGRVGRGKEQAYCVLIYG